MSNNSTGLSGCNETAVLIERASKTWQEHLKQYAESPDFYVNLVATIISLYFVVVLCLYERKLRRNHGDRHKIEDQKLLSGIYKNLPRIFSLIAAIVIFSQIIFFYIINILIFHPLPVQFPCNAWNKIDETLISYSYFFIYLIIWIRQRALYANKLLRHLTNKVTRFLSYASFIISLFFAIVYPLSVIFGKSYVYSICDNACIPVGGDNLSIGLLICLILCMVTFHCLTAFLLAFPIYQSRKAVITATGKHGRNPINKPHKHLRMIKRYLIITLLSILVDVASALTMLIPNNLVYIQNLILLSTIFSLFLLTQLGTTNWIQVLLPWLKCCKHLDIYHDESTNISPGAEATLGHSRRLVVTAFTPLSRSPVLPERKYLDVEKQI